MGNWKIVITDLFCERFAIQPNTGYMENWPIKIIKWKNERIVAEERNGKNIAKVYNDILNESDQEIISFGNKDSRFEDHELTLASKLHRKYESYDILIFRAIDKDKNWLRFYHDNEYEIGLESFRDILPFEITLKSQKIKEYGLRFNEHFGPGGKFPYGLFRVFLHDAYNKGVRMKYLPYSLVMQEIETEREAEVSLIRYYSTGAAYCCSKGFDAVTQYLNHYMSKVRNNEFESENVSEIYYLRADSFLKGACDYRSLFKSSSV